MTMLLGSFNQGFSLWGFVLIPILIISPIVLAWLQWRSISRPDALSKGSWFLLIAGSLFITWTIKPWYFISAIKDLSGFWLGYYLFGVFTAIATIPVLCWEARKNGWFQVKSSGGKKRSRKKKVRKLNSVHP